MSEGNLDVATGVLRQSLAEMKKTDIWDQIVEPREGVLARFQPLLSADHIPNLTEDEIRPFFYIENNCHWSSLYRQVNRVCADMDAFRRVLLILVDEARPIAERLDEISGKVKGLGKGILTALLIVAFPDKFGVWNGTSEDGLIAVDLFPDFERGKSFGAKYAVINETLNRLAARLEIDLWTLDALWWHVLKAKDSDSPEMDEATPSLSSQGAQYFGLERHLHDFLLDNWDHTELGKNWEIYAEPGDPELGYEFRCDVGRIDLLARHKVEKKWLVVELKREKSSDQAIGQVLRYVGWVQHHLAGDGEPVEGLIISRLGDKALEYAVSAAPNITFMTYEVEFRLSHSELSISGGQP